MQVSPGRHSLLGRHLFAFRVLGISWAATPVVPRNSTDPAATLTPPMAHTCAFRCIRRHAPIAWRSCPGRINLPSQSKGRVRKALTEAHCGRFGTPARDDVRLRLDLTDGGGDGRPSVFGDGGIRSERAASRAEPRATSGNRAGSGARGGSSFRHLETRARREWAGGRVRIGLRHILEGEPGDPDAGRNGRRAFATSHPLTDVEGGHWPLDKTVRGRRT